MTLSINLNITANNFATDMAAQAFALMKLYISIEFII